VRAGEGVARSGEGVARSAQLSMDRSQASSSPPDVPTKSSTQDDGHGGQLEFGRDALASIGGAMLSSSYINKAAASRETQVSEVITDPKTTSMEEGPIYGGGGARPAHR
jgi:hypothetical protein